MSVTNNSFNGDGQGINIVEDSSSWPSCIGLPGTSDSAASTVTGDRVGNILDSERLDVNTCETEMWNCGCTHTGCAQHRQMLSVMILAFRGLERKYNWCKWRLALLRSRRAIELSTVKASCVRRIQLKTAELRQKIREMALESSELEVRYDDLMKEKMESDVRFQSEIDVLRQQLTQLKELEAEHQDKSDNCLELPRPENPCEVRNEAPILESLLTNQKDVVPLRSIGQSHSSLVQRVVGSRRTPRVSTSMGTQAQRKTHFWSHDDEVLFMNAFIDEWKRCEDNGERPIELNILASVNARCGNRFPKSARQHLNDLIVKYGKTSVKEGKRNLAKYKKLLVHIRDEIVARGPKRQQRTYLAGSKRLNNGSLGLQGSQTIASNPKGNQHQV